MRRLKVNEVNFEVHMISLKNLQKIHKMCFGAILVTFITIDLIDLEPPHVKLNFFTDLMHSSAV